MSVHSSIHTRAVKLLSAPRRMTAALSRWKEGSRALRESEEKFSKIFAANPDPVVLLTFENGIISEVNESFLSAAGYSRAETIGHSLMDLRLICNEEDRWKLRDMLRVDGFVRNYECWFREQSGILGLALISAEIVTVGGVDRILSVAKDITERKQSEDRIRASLREKELMLKEIHHRVKNNLQVISSLLRLQSRSITDTQMLEFLNESRNRVKSMAMIHEKLYQSKDLAHIDFGDYLRSLATSLVRTYGGGDVTLCFEVADVGLGIDTAIPCGLIVNELISNALKYAFVNMTMESGVRKCITVKIDRTSNGDLLLAVSDNGVGMPASIDIDTSATLGMRLVAILSKQINGRFTLDRSCGTRFSMVIPHK